ncbi:DUF2996 domain-containing protein [Prochlorococcus marinus XMU1414]|uniref:DUF2996 domain-containing protein n=1 Tax=Prochlorococcus marinus XMU1424 TaxID=2774497 RepID=A0A9D9BZ46_PROMR|nr:DUF2996 domain-containing protein [Prochlorococcus marinus]MBO8228267.1 DUF2996 domain-containing protein [Prochlorococcus marinus XMU1414]MBW3045761.1 DUF2996 domain-containing protein [Prochlorococcus marinus str. MU1414]MCR8531958.1 DUF2996 domain-containing protein [Prochlorococcus marinus XMU1420]MCR8536401.1 DUF2996 domain-containing protein [Prochlorococcus marinus XMU1424]
MEENLDKNNGVNKEISDNTTKSNSEEKKESKSEKVIYKDLNNGNSESNSASKVPIKNKIDPPAQPVPKPKKELPVEKKPFQEFINIHLIPALIEEINQRGLEINTINLTNTYRPIAGDKCWVINCEIKDTCNFWLSFEKDDISSLKSISLSKPNQQPSIIESFLIDEKRITLKLIISRVLQRLNGQKLIGVN